MRANKKKKNETLTGINTTYIGQYNNKDHNKIKSKIVKRIIEMSQTEPNNKRSNELGWQSSTDFYNEECIKDLAPFIYECLADYIKKTDIYSVVKNYKITDVWANICPKYSFHKRHTHPNSDISGAYYIDLPNDPPELLFINPHRYMRHITLGSGDAAVTPQEGLLLLFDSGIEHEVNMNLSEKSRISLAFNCQLLK